MQDKIVRYAMAKCVTGNVRGGAIMFGFRRNKEYDVRLTEKQMKELTKNMSRREYKDFEKRQRQARNDRELDELMMMEVFMDDWD